MTLFDRTKEMAKERGLTLRELEKKAGLGQNFLYRWKTYAPKTAYLQKVADVLDVSVDYLLGNTDEKYRDDVGIRRISKNMEKLNSEELEHINDMVVSFLKYTG